jgi:hypothetical protein
MEKVNGRRGFLKGFGIGGVVLGGAASGYLAATREIANVASASVPAGGGNPTNVGVVPAAPDIAHLAPKANATSLVITGDNRPPPPPAPIPACNNGYTFTVPPTMNASISISGNYTQQCPSNELNKVAMAVGKDDRLWIKVGDQWKRVVLEG